MTVQSKSIGAERLDILRWTASLGAVTAEALALRQAVSLASARGRLWALCRRGLLRSSRPLNECPSLFVLTAAGARAAGLPGLAPVRVGASSAGHLIVASARLAGRYAGSSGLHRPDLVLAPAAEDDLGLPVAVEVELTIKAPRRLCEICRAWARCSQVAGVVYLVSERARPALVRAVAAADAGERIAVVRLEALPRWRIVSPDL
jgi:hypothetical protein